MVPTCIGYHGYPAAICTSVNTEVVHCIPSDTVILQEGDIVKIDFVAAYGGYNTDACLTVGVGEVSPAAAQLLRVTKAALYRGIDAAQVGQRIGDISFAIEQHVRQFGYSPIRDTVGHGIGRSLHEDPEVPNYGRAGKGPALVPGMTICIEPIIAAGHHKLVTGKDGWTTRTADGKLAAHFEHTVLITPEGPDILPPWDVD